MGTTTVHTGQGLTKDCYAGCRAMNRYGIFNGLERPRRIDSNGSVTILGFDVPEIVSVTSVATAGNLVSGSWYGYRAVYCSKKYLRPVAVADGSLNYTRGNGSVTPVGTQAAFASSSMSVVVPRSTDAGVNLILLYRSRGSSTEAEAEAGPFYYATQAANPTSGNATITDGTADSALGVVIETDNYYPSAWRYAVQAFNYLFAGGSYQIGGGFSCAPVIGSPTVTVNSGILYDGILGWKFKCLSDSTGGVNGAGMFYANYASLTTLSLIDGSSVSKNYDGTQTGDANAFSLVLPGNILRWSKLGEPESWPTANAIEFPDDITGIAVLPNQPYLLVFTDEPSVWRMDLTLIATASFKTSKRLISTEYSATSHYSLCPVEGKLRGLDMRRKCIIETDGVSVTNITQNNVPMIFDELDMSLSKIRLWHAAYDPRTKIHGTFVALRNAPRICDFCIGQNVVTGSWFFNYEKDLLSTAPYIDPATGEHMTMGGTEGLSNGTGAVWGRIWCPEVYDEWFPSGLKYGTVSSATATTLTVDNSSEDLYTTGNGLAGRWVLVCNAAGEYAQLAYIASNTANVITISSAVNGVNAYEFYPTPAAGWLFYIGLIEMRYGPRRFDFGDPDNDKHVLEAAFVVSGHTSTMLPFIRLFRGHTQSYAQQNTLVQSLYRDKSTSNETLFSRYSNMLEPCKRWGISFYDRSYGGVVLRGITVVYKIAGKGPDGS